MFGPAHMKGKESGWLATTTMTATITTTTTRTTTAKNTHTHKPGLTQAPLTAQSLSHMPSARLPPWKNDQIYKKNQKSITKIELFLGVRFQNNETVQLLKVVVQTWTFFRRTASRYDFYKLIRLNASASSIYFLHFAFMFLLLVFMSIHFNCMSFHFGDPKS